MLSNKLETLFLLSIILLLILIPSCLIKKNLSYAQALAEGGNSYSQGNYDMAEQQYQEALSLAEEKGDLNDILTTLGYLGRVYSAQNRNGKAEEAFQKRVAIAKENELDKEITAEAYVALILFYLTKSRCQEAKNYFDELKRVKASSSFSQQNQGAEEMLKEMFEYKGCLN